jgi:DNA polymerase III subunit alpha
VLGYAYELRSEFKELRALVESSDRAVEDSEWVLDELFAIGTLNLEDRFLRDVERCVKHDSNSRNSSVGYLIGITDIPPSGPPAGKISRGREDIVDIDIDFEQGRRGEVKEYLGKKYGHVASISNFIYFKDKGVIRDAARVFGVPVNDVNKALKQVEKWDDFLETNAEDTVLFRQKYPEVIELAEQLRGRIRSVGMHAAGVVASRLPLEDFAPFETRPDPNDKVSGRVPVVGWDMQQCESVGLIKLDILGLTALDIIHDTVRFVSERGGVHIDLNSIPLDDDKVLSAFSDGHTAGIFQADGATNRSFLMKMGVDHFEDLVAATSLARPGAMNTVGDVYLSRKHGKESVEYVHEIMEPVLKNTFGTIVYQEQVMLAATELGGMTQADANKLRRIIGKKKDAKEFEAYKQRFIDGATKHISPEMAEKLWHDFEAHAGYSFNRSHAVAYSVLSYWMMWLKTYYPLEFMCAWYRHEDDKKRMYVFLEMRRLGVRVKLPHINLSDAKAKIVDDYIRLGLSDIKYISDLVFAKIDKHRPFASYEELMSKSKEKYSGINSRAVSALNAVGALPFADNQDRVSDLSDTLFEYLKIPKFAGRELPPEVIEKLTRLEDYDEDGTYVVKAMVTELKRGKQKTSGKEWVRVEIVDETGVAGVFCDPLTPPEPGQMYILLVGDNSIMEAIPIDDFDEGNDKPFVQFMYNKVEPPKTGSIVILSVEHRFTQRRQRMATIVAANSRGEMRRMLVFPQVFGSVAGKLKPGKIVKAKVRKLEEGGLALQEIT